MKEHITVLKEEAIEALAIKPNSYVVDATLGSLGHARAILDALKGTGIFIGIDADKTAVMHAESELQGEQTKVCTFTSNFRDIRDAIGACVDGGVDGILADLGWRMDQFGGNGRGFSFLVDEPLIMTFGDPHAYPFVAADILNTWEEDNIQTILRGYGEERFSGRIARHIIEARRKRKIETTFDLVKVIEAAVPSFYKQGKIHYATRTFQALRIAVNDEFGALEHFLRESIALLNPSGRVAVITFHSIEDRIVKHVFREYVHDHVGVLVTKKPIVPTRAEIEANKRARSAKLRVFEKNEKV
jgi:16S rRNA (cytosine1402-N4)-methyltransferase